MQKRLRQITLGVLSVFGVISCGVSTDQTYSTSDVHDVRKNSNIFSKDGRPLELAVLLKNSHSTNTSSVVISSIASVEWSKEGGATAKLSPSFYSDEAVSDANLSALADDLSTSPSESATKLSELKSEGFHRILRIKYESLGGGLGSSLSFVVHLNFSDGSVGTVSL